MKIQPKNEINKPKLFTTKDSNFNPYESKQKLLKANFVDDPYLSEKYKNQS